MWWYTHKFENTKDGVDMPSLVRRKSFSSETDLSSHAKLELVIRDLQKRQQFTDQNPDVTFVDESV